MNFNNNLGRRNIILLQDLRAKFNFSDAKSANIVRIKQNQSIIFENSYCR